MKIVLDKYYSNCISELQKDDSPISRIVVRNCFVLRSIFKNSIETLDRHALLDPLATVMPDHVMLAASDNDAEVERFRDMIKDRVGITYQRSINAAQRLFENVQEVHPLHNDAAFTARDSRSVLIVWAYKQSRTIGLYLHPLAVPELVIWWAGSNEDHVNIVEQVRNLTVDSPDWGAISLQYQLFLS